MTNNLKKEREALNIGVTSYHKEEASLMKYSLAYQGRNKLELTRKAIVECAIIHGNNIAAEEFECHRNTVSKWKNVYLKANKDKNALKDRSRAPKNIPHKIDDPKTVNKILSLRDETGYGSLRLKMQYNLEPSNTAINRIYNENGKIQDKRKKWKQRQDLWDIKQAFKTLETKLQLDAKNLLDIPNYLFYYKLLGLPKWQFTLRDVKSGATFLSFMSSENGINASTFMVYVFEHFKRHGIDVSKITIQMDGASYALNLKSLKISAFQELIEKVYGAKLKIIPQAGTCQSDVETLHRLIEDEFYKRQSFDSLEDFYLKAYKYLYNFNFIRKNKHKEWKTPLYYLNQDRKELSAEILDLPPIDLDQHPDLYWHKINPKHVPTWESKLLDLTPDELPCKSFSHDEYLDVFVKRFIKGYNASTTSSAHDVPIHPTFLLK